MNQARAVMNVHDRVAAYGLSADEVMDMAGQIAAAQFVRESMEPIEARTVAERVFRPYLAGRREEVFAVLFLDTRHRLIKLEILFRGTIDGAAVYPRVVAERALRYGAAAVILAHNHPSGSADPSPADHCITERLREVLALLDVRVLDHVVIGAGEIDSVDTPPKPTKTKGRRKAGSSLKPRARRAKATTTKAH